jgi:hypothetical protein
MALSITQAIDALKKLSPIINRKIDIAIQKGAKEIQSYGRRVHRFKRQSGDLQRSISIRFNRQAHAASIFLDTGVAYYAGYVHGGTRPHEIVAKNKKSLLFTSYGRNVFRKKVFHPGTKPDEFLFEAGRALKDKILADIKMATLDAVSAAGVK